MARKVYYKYNPTTDSYERVYPSRRKRILTTVGQFSASIVLGAAVFFGLNYFVDSPRDTDVRNDNDELRSQLKMLNARLDEAQGVMTDIAERDNNFYRVMMQTDKISDATRYAGLERRKLESIPDNKLLSDLNDKMDLLERELVVQSRSFDQLRSLAKSQEVRLAHTPAIQPISEQDLKRMASGYGRRTDPVYGTVRMHAGMDFSCDEGTKIYATADGKVLDASWRGGYGNMVELDHGYGYTTRYAHMSEPKVKPGQIVKRGDLIGLSGNTGKSTGPHLHYEVRINGEPQNPVNYYYYDLTPEEYAEMINQAENAGHMMD